MISRFAKLSVWIGVVIMAAMGIVMYVAAPLMMSLLSSDKKICQIGINILRIEYINDASVLHNKLEQGNFDCEFVIYLKEKTGSRDCEKSISRLLESYHVPHINSEVHDMYMKLEKQKKKSKRHPLIYAVTAKIFKRFAGGIL